MSAMGSGDESNDGAEAAGLSKHDLFERISMLEEKLASYGAPLRRDIKSRAKSFDNSSTLSSDDLDDQALQQIQLTAANTIPQVRKCNFKEFKNRFKPDDGHYAIDVLVSGSLLAQEILEEQKTRDIVASRSTKANKASAAHRAKANKTAASLQAQSSETWIQCIRIQSPALLKIMSRVHDESWSSRPRSFWRPFESLIFFQGRMRDELQHLEDKWASQTDLERKGAMDEHVSAGGSPTDEDIVIDDCPAALHVMRCYVNFIDEEIMPLYTEFDHLDAYSPSSAARKIRFSDLWLLFRTGEFVYYPPSKKESSDPRDIIGSERLWRTHSVRTGIPLRAQRMSGLHRKYQSDETSKEDAAFKIRCHYIDYTGEEFCVVTKTFRILPFSGLRDIVSLELFPLRFAQNFNDIYQANIDIGDRVLQSIKAPHGSYNAWTVMRTPGGEAVVDEYGKIVTHPEHIHSDVMVDFAEAFQACPAWKPKRKIIRRKAPEHDGALDDFPILWWSDVSRTKRQGEMTEMIATRSGVGTWERNRYLSKDGFHHAVIENLAKGQLTTPNFIREEDKAIVSCRVFAYIFQERKFAQLDVRKVIPASGSREALNSLRIPQRTKELVQRSVLGHFLRRDAERREHGRKMSMDVIPGKGDGLFILLHGVPGVGKTATAEAIAQTHGKPLFKITCGDLGLTPESVESRLRHIFRLASLWDCILLLDEVDTFFTQRSKGDAAMTKNALVSVFLRILDYYNGILFMTTNRAGTLDEAFKSRIHYNIYYPHLNKDQTREIWQINIQRLRQVESEAEHWKRDVLGPMEIPDDEILNFAERQFAANSSPEHRWNGRQIRNAFQVARSLARADAIAERENMQRSGAIDSMRVPAPRLDVKYFEEMDDMGTEFNKYLQSIFHGKSSGDLAQEMEVRNDEYVTSRRTSSYYDRGDEPRESGYFPGPQFEAGPPRSSPGSGGWRMRNSRTWAAGHDFASQGAVPQRQQSWRPPISPAEYDEGVDNGPLPEGIRPSPSPRRPPQQQGDVSQGPSRVEDHACDGSNIGVNPRAPPGFGFGNPTRRENDHGYGYKSYQ